MIDIEELKDRLRSPRVFGSTGAEAAAEIERLQLLHADGMVMIRAERARIAELKLENAEALDELTDTKREAKQLRMDAERLDWLENNATIVSMPYGMRMSFPYPAGISKDKDSVRDVIDAVRATYSTPDASVSRPDQ